VKKAGSGVAKEIVMSLTEYGNQVAMATVMGDVMTELVRGQEEKLLARLEPLVRSQSVTLDMSHVRRIDAAGIAALIRLYRVAAEAGHSFAVTHPSSRVEEILSLVGLERLFTAPQEEGAAQVNLYFELSAA
jgi:anti-anti-sigma factor